MARCVPPTVGACRWFGGGTHSCTRCWQLGVKLYVDMSSEELMKSNFNHLVSEIRAAAGKPLPQKPTYQPPRAPEAVAVRISGEVEDENFSVASGVRVHPSHQIGAGMFGPICAAEYQGPTKAR